MGLQGFFHPARTFGLALISAFVIAACGGSGGSDNSSAATTETTGTVGLFFTDAPTDVFSAIRLNVVEAVLIGGDNSQQVLFQGSEPIDLLDLTNFNEPVVFGEVEVGTYTKLRLVIDSLELVPNDGSPSIFPTLPANGKIDLLDASGFAVLPGRTLLVEIDMDANKSIKITKTGNSNKYQFRPVVKAKLMDGGLPDKLARVEGSVSGVPGSPAGQFVLCDIDSPNHCVAVATNGDTSIFDDEGLGTDFSSLMQNDMVVVIGRYQVEPEIILNAWVVEIGGNSELLKGNVVSNPNGGTFLVIDNDGDDVVVELQPGTKFFDAFGEISADAIVVGVDVEVEGVFPAKVEVTDPDLIRAALVFLEEDPDEQLSGTIIEPLDGADRSFGLTLDGGGDTCVRVLADADILLVDAVNSEAILGEFADLAVGQFVDLFGATAGDSCFEAGEVIVEVVSP